MAYRVSEEEFRAIAAKAIDDLPLKFRRRMENVVVIVEDLPSTEDAASVGVNRCNLLGLFHGVSRLHESFGPGGMPRLPERIVLYKRNIETYCRTLEELQDQIRSTVMHEVGHYFGLTEEELRKHEDS